MKPHEVKPGLVCRARLQGRTVPVKVEREAIGGGWWVRNMVTLRVVKIKSAGVLS